VVARSRRDPSASSRRERNGSRAKVPTAEHPTYEAQPC
jgi:hypothetical protein